jgi:polar amino acid transport system substrate-binding protein
MLEQLSALISLDNIFLLPLLLIAFVGIHLYSSSRGNKELLKVVDNKVKVFEKAFDISEDAVLILSDKNEVVYANAAMKKLIGLEDDFKLKPLKDIPKIEVKSGWIELDRLIDQDHQPSEDKMQSFPQVYLASKNNQKDIPINLYIDSSPLSSKHDLWCNIVSIHDLREKRQQKSVGARHQLTGLPNEIQLEHDLNALYSKVHLREQKLALILFDIDEFSILRSIVGVEQVNIILVKLAAYLQSVSTKLDISVYHTYHNNFLITVANVKNEEDIVHFVKDVKTQLASFYKMKDVKLHLTASVGISIYPDSGATKDLLDRVYKALNKAKELGTGRISIYRPEEEVTHHYDQLVLHNEMHEALEKKQFEVYYQPIVDAKNKEVVSAEALIRWVHPQYGLIPPYIFIPIMEQTGFIIELGKYVLEEVLKQQKRWELFKFKKITVAINITLLEIEQKDFVENVAKQIMYHQVKPELIKFEITEGIAMISEESTHKQFKNLKNLGVGISLDDFGTGYTSFAYLKKFPADVLKIDKSMVDYIVTNKEDQRIVMAMIELGHNLGMKVVVEGIEDKSMYELLASYGCDLMQGYHFSKPLPVFEFQKLLR